MDFDSSELLWLTEILRSHQEAIEQLATLPPDISAPISAMLARRQLVLGSYGFRELVELMRAHGLDMARRREEKDTMPREELRTLEGAMTTRLAVIREKIASVKYLLDRT